MSRLESWIKNEEAKPVAAVVGVGRMGTAICSAMRKLGFYVVGADSNENAASNFRKHIKEGDGVFYLTDQNNADKSYETVLMMEKPEVVISSLPYHQTEELAYWCIANEFRYCDLGGRVDVSSAINEEAKKHAKRPVMTDLGLAPGWVNILAEKGFHKVGEAEVIKMMVGGIPEKQINPPLNYMITWSPDGLINEYIDDCEILHEGEIIKVPGMSQPETVQVTSKNWEGKQDLLEAFCTSGGASHSLTDMKERGVKNCFYKTLRYKGHRDIVKFLLDDCKLSRECLNQIFLEGCKPKEGVKDIVIVAAIVDAWPLRSSDWVTIKADDGEGGFSAMQKATAYPISCVAALMAEGSLDVDARKTQRRDYWTTPSNSLTYKDFFLSYDKAGTPYDLFEKKTKELGLIDE